MKKRYKYKLRTGAAAREFLHAENDACRWVWNKCVERFKERENTNQTTLMRLLTGWRKENEWLSAQSVVSQQQAIRDFVKARNQFFEKKRGAPKFKSAKKSLVSLNYTTRGFSVGKDENKRLRLPRGIKIPVIWSRELPSVPSSVRVYQDAAGWWWASFVVEVKDKIKPRSSDNTVGIDLGVKTPATTTDGNNLEYSARAREAQKELSRQQRRMALHRESQDWDAYRKAKSTSAKIQRKLRWQRKEQSRAWAQSIARENKYIACEDFKPRFLAKTHMARKAAENATTMAKQELETAAQSFGSTFVLVNPKYTTMDCSICGARAKQRLGLDIRVYECDSCKAVLDRDVNAARNMILRAGFNPTDDYDIRPRETVAVQSGIPRL